MRLRTLDRIDVAGKTVLVRADLNVPVKNGRVIDATRLERLRPTLNELAGHGARIIVISHFGRPNGKRDPALSLKPVADALRYLLAGRAVAFADDCIGAAAETAAAALRPGEVLVLENLRFHPGEEANDASFAAALGRLGEVYVDDAFSCAHRAHASIEALARRLPSVAGRSLEGELTMLGRALDAPKRPVMAIVGGAKISTKLALLENLVGKVDTLAIGGGMANTLLFARGIGVGRSLCEVDQAPAAQAVLARAAKADCRILLPTDAVVAGDLKIGAVGRTVALEAISGRDMILDIGPQTVAAIRAALAASRTLLWNGPVGAFEYPPFDAATVAIARTVAELTRSGALLSVAGGGETVAAVNAAGVGDAFSYLSTAGGAFLEWIEGRVLPGVAVLMDG
jgi:phosphoglycerate kinase